VRPLSTLAGDGVTVAYCRREKRRERKKKPSERGKGKEGEGRLVSTREILSDTARRSVFKGGQHGGRRGGGVSPRRQHSTAAFPSPSGKESQGRGEGERLRSGVF